MKSLHKKILLALAIPAGIFFVLMIAVAVQSWWGGHQWQKKVDAWQANLRQPYLDDTYGGKTPEETWAMFLDALKKGDVELASKYFWVERQGEAKSRFEESVKLNRLDFAISQFSSVLVKDDLDSEKAYFHIPITNSQGELEAYPVIFVLNPYTKVWKISVL